MKQGSLWRRAAVWLGIAVFGTMASDRYLGSSLPVRADEKAEQKGKTSKNSANKVVKTEDEWRKVLTPQQFYVLRKKGTERPGSGEYVEHKAAGTFLCAGCGQSLFASTTKFESGTGWPSFWQPIEKTAVHEETDTTLGMTRVEVLCARCDGHLGHVFSDGPEPTGLRYCMNSVALKFEPQPKEVKAKEAKK